MAGCACGGACKTRKCACVAAGARCGAAGSGGCTCDQSACLNRSKSVANDRALTSPAKKRSGGNGNDAKTTDTSPVSASKYIPPALSGKKTSTPTKIRASSAASASSKNTSSTEIRTKASKPEATPPAIVRFPNSTATKTNATVSASAGKINHNLTLTAGLATGTPSKKSPALSHAPRGSPPHPRTAADCAAATHGTNVAALPTHGSPFDFKKPNANCCSCVASRCANGYCRCHRAGIRCTGCSLGSVGECSNNNHSKAHTSVDIASTAAPASTSVTRMHSGAPALSTSRASTASDVGDHIPPSSDEDWFSNMFASVGLQSVLHWRPTGHRLHSASGLLSISSGNLSRHDRGWLQKKGDDVFGIWRTRWFRLFLCGLNAPFLAYFKDSNEHTELGRIFLTGTCTAKSEADDNYFNLHVGDRVYHLWSEQSDDAAMWLETLSALFPSSSHPAVTSNSAAIKSLVTEPAAICVRPKTAHLPTKGPSIYVQQQARRDEWLLLLIKSPKMKSRLRTEKLRVLSVCKPSGRPEPEIGEWLYRYQVLSKEGRAVRAIDTDRVLTSTSTWELTDADKRKWFGLQHFAAALELAKKNTLGRTEPLTRWTKNVVYYAVCLVDNIDLGYVGKAKNGIVDRWLDQSSSHCAHAQKMLDGDADKLDRRQFVDVMLAYLGPENFMLIPIAQADSNATLRELEESLIAQCGVRGPLGLNIAK